MIFKHKKLIPDLSFKTYVEKEISIKMHEPDKDQNIYFEGKIPDHVFEKLKNSAEEYKTKESGGNFKQKIYSLTYKGILNKLSDICCAAMNKQKDEDSPLEKKIFVKFNFESRATRDEWVGAGTGNRLNISFQHFIGYKRTTEINDLLGEKKTRITYLSEYVNLAKHLITETKYREGSIQPLHMDKRHKDIENSYQILDWSQEREDFLKDIEQKFNSLGNKLFEFFGQLDNEKLDILIEQKQNLLN